MKMAMTTQAFSYAVSDGTVDSEVGAMTIHVTPVNDAPSSQDRFVGIIGEMPVVFSGNEFAFDDVDDGDSLAHITVLTVPQNGTLYLVPSEVNLPNNPRANGKAYAIDGMEMDALWAIEITTRWSVMIFKRPIWTGWSMWPTPKPPI